LPVDDDDSPASLLQLDLDLRAARATRRRATLHLRRRRETDRDHGRALPRPARTACCAQPRRQPRRDVHLPLACAVPSRAWIERRQLAEKPLERQRDCAEPRIAKAWRVASTAPR